MGSTETVDAVGREGGCLSAKVHYPKIILLESSTSNEEGRRTLSKFIRIREINRLQRSHDLPNPLNQHTRQEQVLLRHDTPASA